MGGFGGKRPNYHISPASRRSKCQWGAKSCELRSEKSRKALLTDFRTRHRRVEMKNGVVRAEDIARETAANQRNGKGESWKSRIDRGKLRSLYDENFNRSWLQNENVTSSGTCHVALRQGN